MVPCLSVPGCGRAQTLETATGETRRWGNRPRYPSGWDSARGPPPTPSRDACVAPAEAPEAPGPDSAHWGVRVFPPNGPPLTGPSTAFLDSSGCLRSSPTNTTGFLNRAPMPAPPAQHQKPCASPARSPSLHSHDSDPPTTHSIGASPLLQPPRLHISHVTPAPIRCPVVHLSSNKISFLHLS